MTQSEHIQLCGRQHSPYVRKIRVALAVKGVDYEFVETNSVERVNELHRKNPRGEMPLLLHDGQAIGDSTVMLEYIEDLFPEPPLLPRAPGLRARVRALEDTADRLGEGIVFGLLLVHFHKLTHLADAIMPRATVELADVYTYLDAQLDDNEWLCGEVSWADLAWSPHFQALSRMPGGLGPRDFPRLEAWCTRIWNRPAVQADSAEVAAELASMYSLKAGYPPNHPRRGLNLRGERAEFLLRCGLHEELGAGIADGRYRVGLPLMHGAQL